MKAFLSYKPILSIIHKNENITINITLYQQVSCHLCKEKQGESHPSCLG